MAEIKALPYDPDHLDIYASFDGWVAAAGHIEVCDECPLRAGERACRLARETQHNTAAPEVLLSNQTKEQR